VKVVREGRRGRPRKWIDPNWLIEAVDPRRRLTKQTLASCLGVDKKTLKRIMEEFGLSIDYSRVTEQRLHELAGQFKIMRPSQGYRMFEAWLFAMGICLPIHQIRKAMDPVDRALRKPGQRKGRGAYEVEGSNTLWHLAGPRFLLSIDEMPKKLHRSEDVWVEDGDFYIAVRSVLSFLPHIITVSL
jgi:hypothetical protein